MDRVALNLKSIGTHHSSVDSWVRSTLSTNTKDLTSNPIFSKSPDNSPQENLKRWNSKRGIAAAMETANSSDELVKNYMKDGNLFYNHGRYFEAISHYSLALLMNCSPELRKKMLIFRSIAYFNIKDFECSLKDSEEILTLAPSNYEAKERKADCLFHLEKYEECISFLNNLLVLEDNLKLRVLKEDAEKMLPKTKDDLTENGKSEAHNTVGALDYRRFMLDQQELQKTKEDKAENDYKNPIMYAWRLRP